MPREEQDLRAIPVLKAAWALVHQGWCRGADCVDMMGRPAWGAGAVAWSLDGAVARAAGGEIEGEYARRVLRRELRENNLADWNDHPTRTKKEVLLLLVRVIRAREPKRRGGWAVSP